MILQQLSGVLVDRRHYWGVLFTTWSSLFTPRTCSALPGRANKTPVTTIESPTFTPSVTSTLLASLIPVCTFTNSALLFLTTISCLFTSLGIMQLVGTIS